MGTTCGVAPATPHSLVWPKNQNAYLYSYFLSLRHSSHNSVPRVVISRAYGSNPTASWIAASSSFVLVILNVWRLYDTALGPQAVATSLISVYSICNQCNLQSVKCIIYMCICNMCILSHQHQCLLLPEQGMMNNISQYFNVFQIVTSARRRNHY